MTIQDIPDDLQLEELIPSNVLQPTVARGYLPTFQRSIMEQFDTSILHHTSTTILNWISCAGEMSSSLHLSGSRRLQNQLHSISKPRLDGAFKSVGMAVWYAENKTVRRSKLSRGTSNIRDKTRGKFGIT